MALMVDPSASRGMVRMPWSRGASAEESRTYLQRRLTLLYQLMFWCFLVLLAFLAGAYHVYRDSGIVPRYNAFVFAGFAVGLTLMAFVWRVWLAARALSIGRLHGLDTFYMVGANAIISFCAVISYDQRQAAYTCLLYSAFAVLTRALIVPSTGTRTAVVSGLAAVPLTIAAVVLPFISEWPSKDVPGPGFVIGFIQIEILTILLAAAGSHIIYGLLRKVSTAQQLGRYTLVRKIAAGGMGEVHLARHLMLRRPTAVKILPPSRMKHDDWRRFEREVQHLSQLSHPNTVAVFDYGYSPDGLFYYAMEYLGGGIDLDRLVRQHGRQPAERVRQILVQICGALDEAHGLGIVHRDVKPANVILCERGAMPDIVKVVDFGLAKQMTAETGSTAQVILGTPGYVAPETVADGTAISPASDLYALGCVGFYLLAGRGVFEAKTSIDLCIQHVTKPAPRPSEIASVELPRTLEDLVLQCLAKDPGQRPASAAALACALNAVGPFPDWDEARANAWWEQHRTRVDADAELAEQPTRTLPIDVIDREPSRPPTGVPL